jgi:ubiquitin carboxyl-terminal hydrolase 8
VVYSTCSGILTVIRNCPKCKVKRRAKKQLTISRLPEILLIHLKRFYFSGPFRNKIETYVEFPVVGMDMSRYDLIYECLC